jgi:hypothetical protein
VRVRRNSALPVFAQPLSQSKSKNSVRFLQGAHIFNNHTDLLLAHAFHRFHVAKPPMMRFRAFGSRTMERLVGVMPRMVNAMQEGRTFVRSGLILTMATRTIFTVGQFSENGRT